MANIPKIELFGLQSGTDRTIFVTWSWDKDNVDYYEVLWRYTTGDGVAFIGNDGTEKYKQSVYTAPSNATKVMFKVKPVSKTRKVNDKDTYHWTADWSTEKTYNFNDNPPTTPPVPDFKIDNEYYATASFEKLDLSRLNADGIGIEIIKNDTKRHNIGHFSKSKIEYNYFSWQIAIESGYRYKARARTYKTYGTSNEYSDWSEFTGNVETVPMAPNSITKIQATSDTSIRIEWSPSATATSYDIEYATEKRYFDGTDQTTVINGIKYTHYEKTGLESGKEYFFRVRAVNSSGESHWTDIKSIVIGKKPDSPTTWSSTTTGKVGESITLYWVHNSEDGSSQTYAELEITVDGTTNTYTVKNTEDEEEKDKTSSYIIDTSGYSEGATIKWRVRTKGITNSYGDWSIERTITIYAPPTLELDITDLDGNSLNSIESFPFYLYASAGPSTQLPIGYHVSITSNETYETVDDIGNKKVVSEGDEVYSKYFDISAPLLVRFSADNLDIKNNVRYTITCVASMDSGLTAELSIDRYVNWYEPDYEPNAEISIDEEKYSAYIRPYCTYEDGTLVNDVTLSVYRREFDGSFTELGTEIDNTKNVFVTDPHPSLDYARYRIVAVRTSTGAVSYYDIPGYPLGCKSVIIQWDEEWSNFETSNEDALDEPSWSGSLLKLPYNIDVSDDYNPDVSLIKYVGREHPVTYYGTQLGSTSTWNVSIEKSDEETLYALRRLARWMGDVYVREPSGSGYWANITVSFSQKHCELTIPVTLNITRVEGGA